MAHSTHSERLRELDCRSSDGIAVTLLWWPGDDHLVVEVVDSAAGAFRLRVAAADGLDAFRHPYAYAAFAGVDYAAPTLANGEPALGRL